MLLILACLFLLLAGGGLAFGPLNVKMDKLRPGQSPQDAIKKNQANGLHNYRHIHYSVIIHYLCDYADDATLLDQL
ncbi:hypothetical protein [Hungatella sp.]|uniref:hypothetical protein n=1 Tax=Hungatella sp. TaxID=2613924 RepID=UPI00399257EF